MCGILLSIQRRENVTSAFESIWESLKLANSARGPDAQENVHFVVQSAQGISLDVRFFASELRLRGDKPVVQPHRASGNVLCWNGEVFEGLQLEASENDGIKLFQVIHGLQDLESELPAVFQGIEGPYAFSYFHDATKRIYFGRDPLGRRSLLIHKPTTERPLLLIASVSAGSNLMYELEELGTEQLYCVELQGLWTLSNNEDESSIIRALPRRSHTNIANDFSTPERVNTTVSDAPPIVDSLAVIPPELVDDVDGLLAHLSHSVKLMVQDIPYYGTKGQARIAVLFSGGVDCTVLAYLADRYLPPDEPIDLLNVAFENPRKIQSRPESSEDVKKKKRPQHHKNSSAANGRENGKFDVYLVPDRVTGLEELDELRKLCPHRRWNFVEVDVTFEETSKLRSVVESLMYPCRTVMDLSLALALYFASRGIGRVRTELEGQKAPYTSTARVLLNGLGADELLGGYGRHRTIYTSGGWTALIEELQLEIDRIPARNLGRDDRVISSHGKEARHPFLSLSVVNYIAKLPVQHKLDPRLPLGLGDKQLLRLAARKIGLEIASARRKRAMQFGSHSARMEAGDSQRRGDLLIS